MAEDNEQLDLVNNNDIPIGTIRRSEVLTLNDGTGRYVRTAGAFIRNREGKYWIPRRTADKRIAPNGLDFSMSEHMGGGESYLEAVIRGFQEELTMHVDPDNLLLVGILGPLKGLPYFSAVYIYGSDSDPDFNPKDFQNADWLSLEQVIAQINAGVPAKDSLLPGPKLILLQEGRL
jgi:isopentenyldiphosphate isomerase